MSDTNTGIRIKAARKRADMTQSELAEKAGISLMSVRRYEHGSREPSINTLKKIAEVLGIPTRDLIDVRLQIVKDELIYDADVSASRLIESFNRLNDYGKQVAAERIYELTCIDKYRGTDKSTFTIHNTIRKKIKKNEDIEKYTIPDNNEED